MTRKPRRVERDASKIDIFGISEHSTAVKERRASESSCKLGCRGIAISKSSVSSPADRFSHARPFPFRSNSSVGVTVSDRAAYSSTLICNYSFSSARSPDQSQRSGLTFIIPKREVCNGVLTGRVG